VFKIILLTLIDFKRVHKHSLECVDSAHKFKASLFINPNTCMPWINCVGIFQCNLCAYEPFIYQAASMESKSELWMSSHAQSHKFSYLI